MGTQRGSGSGTQGTTQMSGRQGRPDNATYDLISVMYHALQGCEQYEQYAQDAQQTGQQEIAQFFRDAIRQNEQLAQRGQQLLAQCLQQGQGQGGRSGQQLHSQNVGSSGQQGGTSGSSGSGSSMSAASGTSGNNPSSGSGVNTSRSGSGSTRGSGGSV
jgi:hypothetical protein